MISPSQVRLFILCLHLHRIYWHILYISSSNTSDNTHRSHTFLSSYLLFFLIFDMMNESREMAPSPRHSGVRRISGFNSDSTVGERVDSPNLSIGSTHDRSSLLTGLVPFTIHFTNIRGLNSNLSSVEHHLGTHLPNILLLSETQLANDASINPFQISHYTLYSNFRFKGGVCAYCNTNTPIARFEKFDCPTYDVIWLKILLPTTTIFLCFCYCSPNSTNFTLFFEYLTSCRESLLSSHPHAEVLFIGDFNVHNTEWLGSATTDVGGTEAHSFSVTNEMEQLIKHPTRIPDRHDHTGNILDLFFTSNPSNYSYSISAPLGSSDHKVISVSCSFSSPPPIPSTTRQLWFPERAQCDDIRTLILDFPWDKYCFLNKDANVVAPRVGEVFTSIIEAYVPSSTKSFSPAKPWFDRACSGAVRAKERAHESFLTSPSVGTHASFNSARNRCTSHLRRRKFFFTKRKTSVLNSSPTEKKFWSLANKILKNFCKSNFPPLIRPDGSIACSPTEKATLFGSLFSSNSSLDDSNASVPPTMPLSNSMPTPIISVRKVRRVLASLKIDKASGPDRIPAWFLKQFAAEIAPVLSRLFRLILNTCTYPSVWKHAFVHPVPKKGDRSNPSNYRPIALTSTIAKVFETLLNSHFIKHLESNHLLSDHQYGFRMARSTGDLLSYLTDIWSSALRDFGESFIIALDISKAFDRVWHQALLAKLPAYGFTPPLCNLIRSFLSDRFISVVVDGATSAPFPISSGVPQGSVLSPTLFLLFINDLLHSTSSPMHSFADDSTLHISSSFSSRPSSDARSDSRITLFSNINSDLRSISEWGSQNLVKFNASKTQFLPISLSTCNSYPPIIFEDNSIEPLSSINILGIQISSKFSWRSHIIQIAKSASKKLGVLFRCRKFFTSAQLFKLYIGLIRPCLEYCSHIWGSSPAVFLLDRVQSKAIRLINDHSLTSSLDSLSLRREVASLSLFYRYYFGHCSAELRDRVPRPLRRPRCTRQAVASHQYSVELCNHRIERCSDCFFPSTSVAWNSLPAAVFPASYNLSSFKRHVYHHLRV